MTFDDSRLRRNAAIVIAAGLFVAVQQMPATRRRARSWRIAQTTRPDTSAVVSVVVMRRGRAVVGSRGGIVVRRLTVVRPAVRTGRWVRPGWYRWPPGGAIPAGAAISFLTAATAAAWAESPPAPGYCWYYTDPSRRQGF